MDLDPGAFAPTEFGKDHEAPTSPFPPEPDPLPASAPAAEPPPEPSPAPEEAVLEPKEPEPTENPLLDAESQPDPKEFKPAEFGQEEPELEPKPEPKPDDLELDAGGEGMRNLRAQYGEVKAKADRYEAEIEDIRTREAEAIAQADRFKKENDQLRSKVTRTKPEEHPDVTAITAPIMAEVTEVAKDLSITQGEDVGNKLSSNIGHLARQYMAIGEPGVEGFDDRRVAFNETIDDNFGSENSRQLRGMIARAASVLKLADQKIHDLKESEFDIELDTARAQHRDIVKNYAENIEPAFTPDADLQESDPLNPLVIISKLVASNEDFKAADKTVRSFCRYTSTPLPPIHPGEIQGKSQEEVDQLLQAKEKHYAESVSNRDKMAYPGLMWMRLGPVLYKEYLKRGERLKQVSTIAPPIPNGGANPSVRADERDDGTPQDIRDFEPIKAPS